MILSGFCRFEWRCFPWPILRHTALGLAIFTAVAPLPEGAVQQAAADQRDDQSLSVAAARILSRHCLECHDSVAMSGDLDLTRQEAAFAGGESGPAIVGGKIEESLLWDHIESENMPPTGYDRLTAEEQALIKRWIAAGAPWPAEVIDPAEFGSDLQPPPTWLRRLTVPQYIATVAATTGVDIAEQATRRLPADQRADGFTNTAYNLGLDLAHVEAYAQLAEIVATKMNVQALLAEHAACQSLEKECISDTIASLGKSLFRGPLSEPELQSFIKVFDAVIEEGGDFAVATRLVTEAMLQSPRFLFLIEQAAADSQPQPVSGFELASRLSYALWGAPPDAELVRAVEAGELDDPVRVLTQVQRMLRDERAVEHSLRFAEDWLDLARLANLRPQPQRFPKWDAVLAADMRQETLRYFEHVAWRQNRPLSDLMNAQITFLTPRLAQHYGIDWDHAAELAAERKRLTDPGQPLGLVARYGFQRSDNGIVVDTAGSSQSVDLQIADGDKIAWTNEGLKINSETRIMSDQPAKPLIQEIKKSNELTLEAWILPEDRGQKGPARIVSISSGASERNLTLGQEGDQYIVRCRAAGTDNNGMPDLRAAHGSVELRWTHLVFVVDKTGKANFYVNGESQATAELGGDFSKWDENFHLVIGNETTNDRPWKGTLRRVAIYSRALSLEEVIARGNGLVAHELSHVTPRGGLLTQGSVLSIGGDEASMVARGLFVLQDLLYGRVGNPPPCIDSTPQPSKPGISQRDIALTRLANGACSGCHAKFEPFAFGLERFDGVGGYHEVDEFGNQLRDDGEIIFPGSAKPLTYKSSAELMDLLAGSERVKKGITRKLTQFAIARPLVPADAAVVDRIHERGWKQGGTYASLMTEILTSDLLRLKHAEAAP